METLFGTLVIAIPVLLVGYLLLWKSYRPIFWMLTGALAVGLGYLGFVGASDELGKPFAEAIQGYSSTSTATKPSSESEMPAAAMKGAGDGGDGASTKSMSAETTSSAETTEPAMSPKSPSDGRYVTE